MKCRSYANDPSAKQYSFVVRRGIRLGMQLADGETYDPFLLFCGKSKLAKNRLFPRFGSRGHRMPTVEERITSLAPADSGSRRGAEVE